MNKKEIADSLMKKLNEVADGVVKELQNKPPAAEPAKTEPAKTEPTQQNDSVEKGMKDEIAELKAIVVDLSKKFTSAPAPAAPPKAEEGTLEKKQAEVQNNIGELVKAMGIDPENVDVQFVIKEKKKGAIDGSNENFTKSVKTEGNEGTEETEDAPADGDLNKQLEALDDDSKQEALNHYFKSAVFGSGK